MAVTSYSIILVDAQSQLPGNSLTGCPSWPPIIVFQYDVLIGCSSPNRDPVDAQHHTLSAPSLRHNSVYSINACDHVADKWHQKLPIICHHKCCSGHAFGVGTIHLINTLSNVDNQPTYWLFACSLEFLLCLRIYNSTTWSTKPRQGQHNNYDIFVSLTYFFKQSTYFPLMPAPPIYLAFENWRTIDCL